MEPTILVIDDSSFVHAYVRSLMSIKGYRVISAYDWPEVRMALKNEEKISLCLIDIHLPGMRDGDELAKGLRMHPKLKGAKLVFYSGSEAESLAEKTKAIGLDGYIVKGDSDREFIDTLQQYLPLIDAEGSATENEDTEQNQENRKNENRGTVKVIKIQDEEEIIRNKEAEFNKSLDQAFEQLQQDKESTQSKNEHDARTKKRKKRESGGWWNKLTGKS